MNTTNNTVEVKTEVQSLLSALQEMLMKGSLSESDHKRYTLLVNELHKHHSKGDVQDELLLMRKQFPSVGSDATMQGLAFVKKHGYAGDFEIIDKIYTSWESAHPEFRTWDKYFHAQVAPIAVRNRKTFFKQTLKDLGAKCGKERIEVLNLASGPCRDLLEFFQETQDFRFHFTCVELDPNAIAYAKNLLGDFANQVTFINQNIFRFVPSEKYDLVWSAGLFDYFDDNTFAKILTRFRDQSSIIIGNFSDANPTDGYMELIGEWYLNYRNENKLIDLAKQAGFAEANIDIMKEPTAVNLFLRIDQ